MNKFLNDSLGSVIQKEKTGSGKTAAIGMRNPSLQRSEL